MKRLKMIYITGDSFAYGDELGDHLLPGFPGYQGEADPKSIQRWNMERSNNNEFRLDHRWSTVLGKLLEEDIVNKSLPGKSIHGMVTNISLDLELIKKSKMVFVQITGLHRFQIPYFKTEEGGWIQENYVQINTLIDDSNFFRKSQLNQFSKMRFLLNNDQEFLYDYLNQILLIQQLVKSSGAQLFLLDSIFLASCGDILSLIDRFQHDNIIADMLAKTNFKEEITRFPSMWDIYNANKSLCKEMPAGHYCSNTHKLFAEKIYELLKANT